MEQSGSQSESVQSTTMGKAWQQAHEAADHSVSVAWKQKEVSFDAQLTLVPHTLGVTAL